MAITVHIAILNLLFINNDAKWLQIAMCVGKHRFLVWIGLLDTRNCISSSAMSYFAVSIYFRLYLWLRAHQFSSLIDDDSGVSVRVRTITAICVSLGECQKDSSSHPGPNAREVFADDKTGSEMLIILARAC